MPLWVDGFEAGFVAFQRCLILVLNGKGGVGESFFAVNLVQHLIVRNAVHSDSFGLYESLDRRVRLTQELGAREIDAPPSRDWLVETLNRDSVRVTAAATQASVHLLDLYIRHRGGSLARSSSADRPRPSGPIRRSLCADVGCAACDVQSRKTRRSPRIGWAPLNSVPEPRQTSIRLESPWLRFPVVVVGLAEFETCGEVFRWYALHLEVLRGVLE